MEPHFSQRTNPTGDNDFPALIAARWSEYHAEWYLRSAGNSLVSTAASDDIRVGTPIQMFLAYSHIARARLEIKVYGELLEAARPEFLKGMCYFARSYIHSLEFDEILGQPGPDMNVM